MVAKTSSVSSHTSVTVNNSLELLPYLFLMYHDGIGTLIIYLILKYTLQCMNVFYALM